MKFSANEWEWAAAFAVAVVLHRIMTQLLQQQVVSFIHVELFHALGAGEFVH